VKKHVLFALVFLFSHTLYAQDTNAPKDSSDVVKFTRFVAVEGGLWRPEGEKDAGYYAVGIGGSFSLYESKTTPFAISLLYRFGLGFFANEASLLYDWLAQFQYRRGIALLVGWEISHYIDFVKIGVQVDLDRFFIQGIVAPGFRRYPTYDIKRHELITLGLGLNL
jgi:hypothetical protein